MNLLKDLKNLTSDISGKTGPTQDWYITAERAEGLRDKDTFSKSDPYLKIEFGGKHVKTRTIKNDLSPYWNETFHFQIAAQHVNDIRIIAMDSDIAFDDTIGSATISRADLPIRTGEETFLKVPIYSKQQVSGIVHLRVKLLNDGQTSVSTQPMYQSSSISSYPPQQMSTQSQYSSQQPPYNPQYNQPPNYNTSVTSTQQPYSQTQPSYYSQNQPYSQPPYNQNQYQGQMPPMMNQQYQNPQQPYTYQQPPQQQYMNQQPQSNYYNKPYERPY